MERFAPDRACQTPEEWTATESTESASGVRVFAVDLNGHYSAAFACHGPHGPLLVLLNSTDVVYIDRPSMLWLYDLVFPPTEGSKALCAAPHEALSGVSAASLQELVQMGFDEGSASSALAATEGNVGQAVELLLGGV